LRESAILWQRAQTKSLSSFEHFFLKDRIRLAYYQNECITVPLEACRSNATFCALFSERRRGRVV